jgi:hypothetical protein
VYPPTEPQKLWEISRLLTFLAAGFPEYAGFDDYGAFLAIQCDNTVPGGKSF